MEIQKAEKFEFDEFQLDVARRRLLREGAPVTLNPKAFDMLLALVKNCGKLLSKNDLFQMVWADQIVEESNLTVNMSQIRRALGERASAPRFIATISGQGYRFVAQVRQISDEAEDALVVHEKTRAPLVIGENDAARFQTLAVLPFKTLGGAEENQFLALGMADALITKLSRLEQLRVRPTSAVIKYGGAEKTPFEAGRELKVESVIEGSVWQIDERLRVTVQLVRVETESTVWAEKFDNFLNDIFELQDSISERVAAALEFRLTGNDRRRLARRETENLTAYQLYLRGLYHFNHFSPQSIFLAIACFEQAVQTDPDYALAYAMLFGAQMVLASMNVVPVSSIVEKARSLAAKAARLDETLPAAHYTQGFSKLFLDWNARAAEKHFRRALELNPNDVLANKHMSIFLFLAGRFEEAFPFAHFAHELDPLAADKAANIAHLFYFARRFDESLAWHRKALEIDPQFVMAQVGLAFAFAFKDMFEETFAILDTLDPSLQKEPMIVAAHGFLAARAGDRQKARECLRKISEISTQRYVSPFETAAVYAGLEEADEAFFYLEKAFAERNLGMLTLEIDPRFDRLRRESRLRELLARAGLRSAH